MRRNQICEPRPLRSLYSRLQCTRLLSCCLYPHNTFLMGSATMQGQSKLSIESAQRVVDNVNIEQVQAFPTIEFFRTVPLLSLVRFAKWKEILEYPQPFEEFLFAKGIWHYARGVAFAAIGEQKSAENELTELILFKWTFRRFS